MSANAFPTFNHQFFLDDGTVADSHLLYTYISLTTTNKTTYTDAAGTIPNANPIVLSTSGRCTMFGANDAVAYTLVLKTPSGVVVKTWDSVLAVADPAGTGYLPLSGGTMTGLITLSGDGTAALNPVSKQQLDAAITASAASVAASVSTATAAAAAATAAVAAFVPSSFSLRTGSGGAVSRTVTLSAGTWQVGLETKTDYAPGAEANHDFTVTQAATVGSTTVNTTNHFYRAGGSGYGRITHSSNLAVGTLTVATSASFTMAIAAASLGSASSAGSILTLEKTA